MGQLCVGGGGGVEGCTRGGCSPRPIKYLTKSVRVMIHVGHWISAVKIN